MNFAIIGAAGYVAPKHLQAIKDVGGNLIAAMDPHDSVGILDSYFPYCNFFTDFGRMDRFCSTHKIDYVAICSPNHTHDMYCRFAMRIGADAICEKPLVLNERNLDALLEIERITGKRVFSVLQCRYHPSLFDTFVPAPVSRKVEIDIEYITPRGNWYDFSWKADVQKSGGLATNIGVHLFDLVTYLYGPAETVDVKFQSNRESVGVLETTHAHAHWRLSIHREMKPSRIFRIDGKNYDLTNGFGDLHTKVYQEILAGKGFGIEQTRESIKICEAIRQCQEKPTQRQVERPHQHGLAGDVVEHSRKMNLWTTSALTGTDMVAMGAMTKTKTRRSGRVTDGN